MTTFQIQMMTTESYHNYMIGSSDYYVITEQIEAENKKEACEKAHAAHPELVINEAYIRDVEEIKKEYAERDARYVALRKAEEERKANAKARKEARESAKAAELGLTVEEYKERQRKEKKAKKLREQIEQLTKELEEAKAKLARLENAD